MADTGELLNLLHAYKVPLNMWGCGEAKSFDHLVAEVQSGEATIVDEGGALVRVLACVGLLIYHRNATGMRRLREDRQVFKDGRVRRRNFQTAPSEKIHLNERPLAAAYRALREELGIVEYLPLRQKPTIVEGPSSSSSFPGLSTRYTVYVFKVLLSDHLYKPEGYVEVQPDKKTYFVWELIRS